MININGILIDDEVGLVSIENRGLLYGDAVFETLRVSSREIFFWEDHYFRLMASLRILRMDIPMNYTMEFLQNEILRTIPEESDKINFRIKMYFSRKAGGKYTPRSNDLEYFIKCESIEGSFYIIDDAEYEIELFKDHLISSELLSTLKTNSKTIHVLGSIYAKENGYHNCLILNEKKNVVEALNGNIFIVKENTVITPPLDDGCLRGIIRKQIISIIGLLEEYRFEERSISPFELLKADEMFITNVMVGIQPVSQYRNKNYSNVVAKQLLPRLNALLRLS
jgi:branched-chain amino acid aminotransferase